ncbi:probable inactive poly [ADP-ribose] polymerase SRO5 isoform X5 [Aristolochia californica]|uniref:probable inactive poly [ADP-ribose] polymerase SRO5 isoform X5 n=1 Tax=Aristolochia californica TaxID=171875 RepID=UPI0035E13FF5
MDVGVGLTGERYSSSQFFFRRNSESNISGPGTSSEHVDIEASASGSTGEQEVSFPQRNNEMETSASDSESNVSDSRPMKSGFFGDKMMTLDDDDKHHNSLQRFFLSDVTAKKRGGKINMKCAWYGASKDEIRGILNHGFGLCERPENGALFGSGVYLSPASSSQDGIISSVVDESGLRHVLLCRVILGDVEEVGCGSKQFHPSSEEFDSGVDNLSTPKRYIIWSTHMNTHILPEFVISFRGLQCLKQTVKKPTSAWMPFPKLIGLLSEFLPPNEINLIKLYFNDYQAKKITREHMIKRVRLIAGDKLLASVIKSFRSKVCLPVAM